jgi:hypothetical protein
MRYILLFAEEVTLDGVFAVVRLLAEVNLGVLGATRGEARTSGLKEAKELPIPLLPSSPSPPSSSSSSKRSLSSKRRAAASVED